MPAVQPINFARMSPAGLAAHVRFDERVVETELRQGYLGTARRKGRQQTNRTYRHRATLLLYCSHPDELGRDGTAPAPCPVVEDLLHLGGVPGHDDVGEQA
jgi:hypothetical protein